MRTWFGSILSMVLLVIAGFAYAANLSDPIDGVYKGAFGDTITITVASNQSKSPDLNPPVGDLSFQVNSNTGYKNFNQLTDLKVGDPVRVEYSEDPNGKNRRMVATMITKLDTTTVSRTTVVVPTSAPQAVTYTTPQTAVTYTTPQTVTTTTTTTTVSNREMP